MTVELLVAPLFAVQCNTCETHGPCTPVQWQARVLAGRMGWKVKPSDGPGSRSEVDLCPHCRPADVIRGASPATTRPGTAQWFALQSLTGSSRYANLDGAHRRCGPSLQRRGWVDRGYRITDAGRAVVAAWRYDITGDRCVPAETSVPTGNGSESDAQHT